MNAAIRTMAERYLLGGDSEERLQAYGEAFETHDTPIVIVRPDDTIRYLNQAALAMAGTRSASGLVGRPAGESGLPWHAADLRGPTLKERLAHGESSLFFEVDGCSYVCEGALLHDRLDREIGVLECVRAVDAWASRPGIDASTSVDNKARFLDDTRRLLDRHPDERYAMVYWSVIRFHLIVDVFSAATGESVLKSIADTIKVFVGEEGTYGRVGDSSFAFCMPARRLSAEWFRLRSEVTLVSDTAMYTFKSTFGVYEPSDLSCPVATMCERAAFAQASLKGTYAADGACFAFYDDAMHKRVLEEQELVSQLSYALASGEIRPYYQPIFDIKSRTIASAEALARWVRPDGSLVFPGRFIPLFESNGMIPELDQHLWNQVGAFLDGRLAAGEKVVPVSINVSRVDFFATTLMDEFDEIVSAHKLPRELLRIEVTESAYTDDPGRIMEIVRALRERGHAVLLDDFGSGYSSLNTLKDMPIDILKLDMSFLRGFESDDRNKYIIGHVVAMAHDLGLRVVAEGVETAEQLEFLGNAGCDYAQGYYFSRPLPESDFVALLAEASAAEA